MSTVPLYTAHQRPLVDLTVVAGRPASGRFWVDTGGGGFIATETFADRIRAVADGAAGDFAPVHVAAVLLGGLDLALDELFVGIGMQQMPFGVQADGLLPGRVLRRWRVTFDYRKGRFSVDEAQKPLRHAIPAPVHPESGFPRLEIEVAGERYGMLLDTGASHSMVSDALLDRWLADHPDWPHTTGAFGTANMGLPGEAGLRMVEVPELHIGAFTARHVSFVARRTGVFEETFAPMMTSPVEGAIGGNVLAHTRLTIDYPRQEVSLGPPAAVDARDAAIAPLVIAEVLAPLGQATHMVVGALDTHAFGPHAPLAGAGPGLLAVDGEDVTGLSLPDVIARLGGVAGSTKRMLLESDSSPSEVAVPVVSVLGGRKA